MRGICGFSMTARFVRFGGRANGSQANCCQRQAGGKRDSRRGAQVSDWPGRRVPASAPEQRGKPEALRHPGRGRLGDHRGLRQHQRHLSQRSADHRAAGVERRRSNPRGHVGIGGPVERGRRRREEAQGAQRSGSGRPHHRLRARRRRRPRHQRLAGRREHAGVGPDAQTTGNRRRHDCGQGRRHDRGQEPGRHGDHARAPRGEEERRGKEEGKAPPKAPANSIIPPPSRPPATAARPPTTRCGTFSIEESRKPLR